MISLYFDRIKTIDDLIRIKGTGPPKQFAQKLGISQSSLYAYLQFMKEMDAPIAYSKTRRSYFYKNEGGFYFRFRITTSSSA